MREVFCRSAFNYDMAEASDETGLACEDASLTKQSFAEDADINTIVRRFGVTGQLPVGVRQPMYGDFENVMDYHGAMTAITQARESFMMMPAEIRARFHNDPAEFVDFCSKQENKDEAIKLGLVLPQAAELAAPPIRVEVVPPAAPAAPPPAAPAPDAPAQ